MQNPKEFLWEHKYQPYAIADCILPKEMRTTFAKIIKDQNIGNYLFESTNPGTGKTTCAMALCNEIGAEVLFINASEVGSVDTLRNDIKAFASTVSLTGSLKVVVLDEFDNVSDTFQKAFRGFIDEYTSNCRFILTCNYANNIIEPIRSRMKRVTFSIPDDERIDVLKQMTMRCLDILKKENVTCENPRIIGEVISAAVTRSASVAGQTATYTFDQPIIMKSGQIMTVVQSVYTTAADQTDACAFAGDY